MSNEDDKHGNNLTTKHLINKNLDLLKWLEERNKQMKLKRG